MVPRRQRPSQSDETVRVDSGHLTKANGVNEAFMALRGEPSSIVAVRSMVAEPHKGRYFGHTGRGGENDRDRFVTWNVTKSLAEATRKSVILLPLPEHFAFF